MRVYILCGTFVNDVRRFNGTIPGQPKLTMRVTCGTILRNVKMAVNIKDLYGNPGYRFKKISIHRNSQ